MVGIHDEELLRIAWMTSQGLSNSEVAKRLPSKHSQSTISRRVTAARNSKLLRDRINWPEDLDESDKARIINSHYKNWAKLFELLKLRSIENQFGDKSGAELGALHVMPSPVAADGDSNALTEFGRGAAPLIESYLEDEKTKIVGVAWGRTIGAVISNLGQTRHSDSVKSDDDEFGRDGNASSGPEVLFPLAGAASNVEDRGLSSSDACRRLGQLYDSAAVLSLDGVPARLWLDSLKEPDAERYIRAFVRNTRSWTAIFHRTDEYERLMDKTDLILASIGTVRTSRTPINSGRTSGSTVDQVNWPDWVQDLMGWVEADRLEDDSTVKGDPVLAELKVAENLQEEDLSRMAVGNIAGVWIHNRGVTDEEKERLDGINKRWLGVQREDIRNCAVRARTRETPGVVVVAHEPDKADVVLECLGLISVLIVSRSMADALYKALQPKRSKLSSRSKRPI